MKWQPYTKYKESGVEWLGEVPEHWVVSKVRRISKSVSTGTTPSTSEEAYFSDGTINWFTPGDFGEAICLDDAQRKLSQKSVDDGRIQMFPRGTVFLVGIGATIGKVGLIAESAAANQQINAIVPGENTNPKYLAFLLYYLEPVVRMHSSSSTIGIVNQEKTKSLSVLLPPLDEQQQVVALLDREAARIDTMIAKQERLIELLQEKRQALISHAVTRGLNPDAPMKPSGVEWLGAVPAHWTLRKVSTFSKKITNGFVGPTRDILVDSGVRYLQSLNIKKNRILFDGEYFVTERWSNEHSKSILRAGDVLIVQTGDIGQVAVVPEEFAGANCHALIIVTPDRRVVLGEYLALVFSSAFGVGFLESIQTGALHPHLNCGDVKDIPIPLPPISEQAATSVEVARRTEAIDNLTSRCRHSIDLLREHRTALISAAVTGKIDVREPSHA